MKSKLLLLKLMVLLTVSFSVLVGCSVSKEQAIGSAKEAFEAGISKEPIEPNQQTELFTFYLPPTLTVEEEATNNLVLSKGDQLYLIFSNPAESEISEVNYQQDLIIENEAVLKETLQTEESFNYIFITPYEDKSYKVIVGNGRDKGTTISTLANLKSSVEIISEVIYSIKY